MMRSIRTDTLSVSATNDHATRQVMSFLRAGEAGPPSQRLWSLDLLPEAGPFDWENIDIYDIHGRLLFRDKRRKLKDNKTFIRIRTAASDLLRTPVWSASVGPLFDIDDRMKAAMATATKSKLTPVTTPKKLVCYSYPKLGLLCTKGESKEFIVIDLGDLTLVPVIPRTEINTAEQIACWSPYEIVVPGTIGAIREGWKRSIEALPALPSAPSKLEMAVKQARTNVIEKSLELKLKGQETNVYCAVATTQMILDYYGITISQSKLAEIMHTDASGTTNDNQIIGYQQASKNILTAQYDDNASFNTATTEIAQGRPFKSGIPQHARAGAGVKTEGDEPWLFIYDPWPPGQGDKYWEKWSAVTHTNYILVKRPVFS